MKIYLFYEGLHESGDRPLSQREHIGREDPHIKCYDNSQSQSEHCGGREFETRDLSLGFSEVHEDRNTKVIVYRNSTIEDTQNDEPVKF